MVWQVIDECGHVSDPYISDKTMTREIYIKECLEKILLPFIKKYHKVDEIIFWSDMATCHYKRCVIDWFNSQNIKFIEKRKCTIMHRLPNYETIHLLYNNFKVSLN
jgi:hypothetical protein